MKKIAFIVLLLVKFICTTAYGFSNSIEVINDSWKFLLDESTEPSKVNWASEKCLFIDLPHTWNNLDVTDDTPDYFRGAGWYQKVLYLDIKSGKKYFIKFDGANQLVNVFLNKQLVGTHIGGYTSFSFDITSFLIKDKPNVLEVRVDNSHNENIPPLMGDFNFFGGIYRDVSIVAKSEIHFAIDDFDGQGVYWQTPEVSEKSATIGLFGVVSNHSNSRQDLTIKHIIRNSENDIVSIITNNQSVESANSINWKSKFTQINDPILWSIENPYLYSIESLIINSQTGEVLDQIFNQIGFRWFRFDSEKGFFLNGKPVKLIGASRHQDFPDLGNALPKEIHQQDVLSLKELGLNFLRIAHYPQDQEVLKSCDRLGIICSIEIPIVSKITESDEFKANCIKMLKEMMYQNYNHPSLLIWSYMNEVMLHPRFENDSLRKNEYLNHIVELAKELEDITRKTDPYRYTMISNHGNFDIYHEYGLTKVPMIVGWNLYRGWYESGFEPLDKFLDLHHKELPDKPMIITEYGAGNDPRLTSDKPERFDCSNEFALIFHKYYLNAVIERPFISGSLIWNLNDFSSNNKIDANPYINNKGIHSFNRQLKETGYFYKANLNKNQFVKIYLPYGGILSGVEDSVKKGICNKLLHIYSNLDSITLYHNEKYLGTKPVIQGMSEFQIPFCEGDHSLRAIAIGKDGIFAQDDSNVKFSMVPNKFEQDNFNNFEIRVSCGDNRYILDPEIKKIWLPDHEYKPGSWGFIGGKRYELITRRGIKPGSDQSILNSNLDPLYQTQRIEPLAYKFDTKPGQYEITLCFALLIGSSKYDALRPPFNKFIEPENDNVCFDILINGEKVLSNFIPGQNGINRAVNKKFILYTDKGIEISFSAKQGKPFINGIIVKKI